MNTLKKIPIVASKALGFIYVWLLHALRKEKHVDNKKILIIFGGHIGNAILNIDLILQIRDKYTKENGWSIDIFCNDGIRDVLCTFEDLEDVNFLDISYPYIDGGTKFSIVYKTIKALRGHEYDKIVVNLAHIMPLAAYIVAVLHSNDSIGVFDDIQHVAGETGDIEHNIGGTRWYFQKAYRTRILVDFNTQEVQRQKMMLNHLGINYKVRIYPIKKLCDYRLPYEKYFTVTIDSASTFKRWSPQNFIELVNRLCEGNDKYAVITGGKGEERIFNEMYASAKYPDKLVDLIGRTNFEEWIEIIRGAEFHVGVDSGSIHVASAVGTQSFCIVGVWDGERALPYKIDVSSDETCSPICVRMDGAEDLSCYGCYPKRGAVGSGNIECLQLKGKGENCYCLKNITVDQVYSRIRNWESES